MSTMKTLIPTDFVITEEMRAWAKKKVPQVDIEAQTEVFCDYWRAHGKKMMDWAATWRNWMRRAPEFSRPVNRFSQFERTRPVTPTRTIAPGVQPREHPLFRKPS